MRFFLLILLLLVIGLDTFGQGNAHTTLWTRLAINQNFSEKFKWETEFQYRTQNDFYTNQPKNPLDAPLLASFRTWLSYKKDTKNTFSISPFAYYLHHKIIEKNQDSEAEGQAEIRFSAAWEGRKELFSDFYFVQRACGEYRILTGNDVLRGRYRMGVQYDMNSKCSFFASDELLLNVLGSDIQHFFDHNRTFVGVSYKPHKRIRADIGYMYVARLLRSSDHLLRENNVVLHFYYTLATFKTGK